MKLLSRLSIPTKLTAMVFAIVVVCLVVGFGIIGARHVGQLKRDRLMTSATLADVVGNYCVTSLAFDDQVDAQDALSRLAEFSNILAAALYDNEGRLFAAYSRSGQPRDLPQHRPGSDHYQRLHSDQSEVLRPIEDSGRRYGSILLRASVVRMRAEIRSYVLTLAGIGLGLLLLSLLVARLLQRTISRPILRLAEVAAEITEGKVESSRVEDYGEDELGVLSRGFNTMLDRLESRTHEIEESNNMVRALIEASPLAILGLDRSGRVELWNPEAERLFGVEMSAALDHDARDILPAQLGEIVESCLRGNAVSNHEIELRTADGTRQDLSVCGAPMGADGGDANGAVFLLSDDSERRLTSEALVARERQLQRAQKLEAVGRLASGVSHDFNNILTVVLASCGLLQYRIERDSPLSGHINAICQAAEHGAALARRLLVFGKQKAGPVALVDLNELTRNLESMIRSVLGEPIELEVESSSDEVTALVDAGHIEQVLLNLLLNARDAMPAGGAITVRTERVTIGADEAIAAGTTAGEWVTIAVKDSGVGMSDETLSRVFEPFFTTKARGTGLGLATARDLVREIGGEITLESYLGIGTTVTIWLPRAEATPSRAEPADDSRAPRLGSETILLVEDQAALRGVARTILCEQGHSVLEADCGEAGLALAREHVIDLVVTDVVMPRMSGAAFAREFARLQPSVPVLFMSGYVGNATEGAAPLLSKPFTACALVDKVRELLDANASTGVPDRTEHATTKGEQTNTCLEGNPDRSTWP